MPTTGQASSSSASPPTERALDLLERLAGAGSAGLPLAVLSRELRIAPATAHAVLSALTARGWVRRDDHNKHYVIGAVMLAAAATAERGRPDVQAARAAVHALAGDLGCAVSLAERSNDHLVVIEVASGEGQAPAAVGDRFSFAAPWGPVFAAWGTPADGRDWIARSGAVGRPATALKRLLEDTRARGYSVERFSSAHLKLAQLTLEIAEQSLPPAALQHLQRLVGELTQEGLVHKSGRSPGVVTSLAAPVMRPTGAVQLSIALHPGRALGAREVTRLGTSLVTRVRAL